MGKDVAVVVVEVGYSIFVYGEPVLESFLVVYFSRFYAEHGIEVLCRILCISHKSEAFDVVFLPFVQLDSDFDTLGILGVFYNGVGEDFGIAIPCFVVARQ